MNQFQTDHPIAVGRTAEIYRWGEHQVLKLYYPWWKRDWAEAEARIAQAVLAAGQPAPAVGDLIDIHGRTGLIYERVDGPSQMDLFRSRPWQLWSIARQLADLHVKLHALSIDGLPSLHERLERKILSAQGLTPDLRAVVLRALRSLPEGNRLCHGDFHPGNVLMSSTGPVIIDWMDASTGNPLADVARTRLLFTIGDPPGVGSLTRGAFQAARQSACKTYLAQYHRRCPFDRGQLDAWGPIVAAARLDEGIAREQEWLLAQVKAGLG